MKDEVKIPNNGAKYILAITENANESQLTAVSTEIIATENKLAALNKLRSVLLASLSRIDAVKYEKKAKST